MSRVATEIEIDERPVCPRCGGRMNAGVAMVCGPGVSGSIELPPVCASETCRVTGQRERDDAAIAKAIAAGVIDP